MNVKINLKFFLYLLFLLLLGKTTIAQEAPIFLENPSFEGEINSSAYVDGWSPCLAPDIPKNVNNPALLPGPFGVNLYPIDGDSYMGLVVRDNVSWESVSQELSKPMRPDWCYLFQIALAQSDFFVNHSSLQNQQVLFNEPIILKIWGGNTSCDKQELLGQTVGVNHQEWDSYSFYLCPSKIFTHLTLEAYYQDDEGMVTPNGHLLLDDASPLYPLPYSFGEIEWDKIPKSDYIEVQDVEQLEELLKNYGQLVSFDGDVLPYQIYLDATNGLRYGNLHFETIANALSNFSNQQVIIAILPDESGNVKKRISELKNVFREIGIMSYQYKIKAADKLKNESDWLIENAFLKMKLY